MDSAILDELILGALEDLSRYLGSHEWRGRENELVNLFVFGRLLPRACPPNGTLDPTQLAIEVALPLRLVAKCPSSPKTQPQAKPRTSPPSE